MKARIGLWTAIGWLAMAGAAMAQVPWQGPPAPRPPARPDQPVVGQPPTLERRPAAPPAVAEPFRLTPQEAAEVDRILKLWESRSSAVKTFEAKFKRWEWDPVFGPPNKPRFEDLGNVKYAAPDKGLFEVEGERAEKWICDGKAVFEYSYAKKELIEHRLPPELQGKAITQSPLPFLFGAQAQHLKQQYFIRLITPPNAQGQTWLEVFPRFQAGAANFKRAELILTNKDMTPLGLCLYSPNGKSHTSYQFYAMVVNDPFGGFKRNPFVPEELKGEFKDWTKSIDEPPQANAGRVPPPRR
jgi:TIGR03009 family protein